VGINRDWRMWGRLGKQLPPDDTDWRSWLILGGRGAGKTRAGSEWVKAQALGDWTDGAAQARRIAIVGPTLEQARSVMIEGKSGLLSVHMEAERPLYEPSKRLVTWPNGAIAQLFSADEPESLRGPQFDAAWCDELAKWRLGEAAWDMLTVGAGGYIGGRSLEKVATAVTPRTSPGFPFMRGSVRKG
jgi:phage terminase large subunit-like protein